VGAQKLKLYVHFEYRSIWFVLENFEFLEDSENAQEKKNLDIPTLLLSILKKNEVVGL